MADPRESGGVQGRLSILYSFPHPIGTPGIGWTAWNQVTELVRAGHRVHLVASSVARPIAGLTSRTTTLGVAGVRIPHRLLGGVDRAYGWHDRIAARSVARRPVDVVHAWPLASRRTFEAASDRGIPAVREVPNTHTAHAYDVVAQELAMLGLELPPASSHAFNAARLREEEREWSSATALLTPSDAVARTFLDRGFEPARLLRHRYGYRPGGRMPSEVGPRSRPFTAVFLGRGEPRKGLHYALRAWLASSASEHGRFVVYGSFIPGYRESLETMLAHPSVEVAGFTDDAMGALGAADVLVLPSLEEGSALVTYEAQAAGCVPLVSTASGAELEHGVQGFLHEPRDVATLTWQLDLLSSEPAVLERMRAEAIRHSDRLTWAAATEVLVAAYRQADALVRGAAHARSE